MKTRRVEEEVAIYQVATGWVPGVIRWLSVDMIQYLVGRLFYNWGMLIAAPENSPKSPLLSVDSVPSSGGFTTGEHMLHLKTPRGQLCEPGGLEMGR